MALKVLGVAGSLRENSYSTRGLAICLESAAEFGAETRSLELLHVELPLYRPNDERDLPAVREVLAAVEWADAYILASPDYHGTMSGAMKNFLDFHWSEFTGKLFGYICASHEKGLTVMDEMRIAVRQCYGWSMPYGVSIHGEHDFDETRTRPSDRLAGRLKMLARDLTTYGNVINGQLRADLEACERGSFCSKLIKK